MSEPEQLALVIGFLEARLAKLRGRSDSDLNAPLICLYEDMLTHLRFIKRSR